MPFNVMEYLKPRKHAKADQLQTLAARLHAGDAIDPDEILEHLGQCGATEEQLQAEIDRLERVASLREQISAAKGAHKRMQTIQAEIDKAASAMEKAASELRGTRDGHAAEFARLQQLIEAADRARGDLMEPANMTPADSATLSELAAANDQAQQAMTAARQELARATARMAECDEEHPRATEQARRFRNDPAAQDHAKRWDNAKAARTQQLADAKAAVTEAEAAAEQAAKAERMFREQVVMGGAK